MNNVVRVEGHTQQNHCVLVPPYSSASASASRRLISSITFLNCHSVINPSSSLGKRVLKIGVIPCAYTRSTRTRRRAVPVHSALGVPSCSQREFKTAGSIGASMRNGGLSDVAVRGCDDNTYGDNGSKEFDATNTTNKQKTKIYSNK